MKNNPLTVSVVVVDATEPPGGRQVLGGHRQVDGVGQVELHPHAQAALHKHKVPEPVDAHTCGKKENTVNSVSIQTLHDTNRVLS